MRFLKGFVLAWNMLTLIPFFKVHHFFKGINAISAMSYPLVGFLLGTLLFEASLALDGLLPQTHLHVVLFFLWVTLTGALHLDGFSDTIDGLFVKKEKALEVMKDPHTGGMGMLFSVSFLILKASSLIAFEALYLLPLILLLSRLGVVVLLYAFDYVSSGMSQLIKEELRWYHVAIALLFGFGVSAAYGLWWLFFVAVVFALFLGILFYKRYNGLSGDMYGFVIEVSEVFLLNVLVAAL